ncbi:hypothetical protein EVAR_97490_1 [Eumeta japonica]|uniref:Uncharacterized protein n=1 Tax=Eumeta variegata TaxID=151549 RepID=A0A4C1Z812_EUMVA|nr:hypothetical protein EVAR_97490_1 [Eumeta japonica]
MANVLLPNADFASNVRAEAPAVRIVVNNKVVRPGGDTTTRGWLAGRGGGSARRGAAAGRRYLRNVLGASVIKLGTTSPLIPSERPPARSLTRIKYFSVIISVDSMFQKRPTAGRVLFGDAAPPRSRPGDVQFISVYL